MTERESSRVLANRVLERPWGDPDDDLAVLMIERVAKALEPKCRGFGGGNMPIIVAREFARAAIEAMREPTEAMLAAGDSAIPRAEIDPETGRRMMGREVALEAWSAMIDEAHRNERET